MIAAPADVIFELLTDPAQHRVIDGSGTVQGARADSPARLALGVRFGMQMRMGVGYKMTNEVVEFVEGERIAWRHFGGHIWRYILEPLDPGHTVVTEQYDPSGARSQLVLRLMKATPRNQVSIEQTLNRLQDWAKSR